MLKTNRSIQWVLMGFGALLVLLLAIGTVTTRHEERKCYPVKRRRASHNGFGMAVGILFVAVLLLAGFVTSQAVNHNGQAAAQQAYVDSK